MLLHVYVEADEETLADGVDHIERHRCLIEEEGHVADLLVAELLALLQRVEEARVLAVLESFTGPLDLVTREIKRAAVGEGSSAVVSYPAELWYDLRSLGSRLGRTRAHKAPPPDELTYLLKELH